MHLNQALMSLISSMLKADRVVVPCRWVLQSWHEVVNWFRHFVWKTTLNTAELNLNG